MFRPMRRSRQALEEDTCREILRRNTSGVLAVSGDDGYPYAVPLSYVLRDDTLFFHCAASGHKLDAIRRSDRVSFCVIDQDTVVPEKFTTLFRSVIVFGRARVLEDAGERREALEWLAEKYTPDDPEGRSREVDGALGRVCLLAVRIEHMSGKQAIELLRRAGEA